MTRVFFITGKDLDDFLHDFCADQQIDPASYLKREWEFRLNFERAMDDFRSIQETRATRFKLLYKELDSFQPQSLYDELSNMRSKPRILDRLARATAKVRGLIQQRDRAWIHHPNYKSEFFNDAVEAWITHPTMYSRKHILSTFRCLFDLEGDDSDDEDE